MDMPANRGLRIVLLGATLAGGLGLALYLGLGDLVAGGPEKLRPREVPVRVAFTAPQSGASVAHYQAQLRDVTRGEEDLISPLEFTTAAGPVDSHVVWLMLDYYHEYLVRLRGVAAGGATGPWSEWSDPHYNESPWETAPEPPAD
jgi:hypothetical protein